MTRNMYVLAQAMSLGNVCLTKRRPQNLTRHLKNGKEADHLIRNGIGLVEHDCHWATEQAYKNGYENGKPKWISVKDRLPSKEEYTAKAKDGEEYYTRFLIAYKTDIVEYEIGYYDGYKWMTEMPIRIIKDVLAWMPFPNMPEPPKGE